MLTIANFILSKRLQAKPLVAISFKPILTYMTVPATVQTIGAGLTLRPLAQAHACPRKNVKCSVFKWPELPGSSLLKARST